MAYAHFITYSERVKNINGITFTAREVDIISILISGKSTGTIATYLNIAPKTVESNVRNIMAKLGYNSRERIISFVEQAGRFNDYYRHYIQLAKDYHFTSNLQKIKKLTRIQQLTCRIILIEKYDEDEKLLKQLANHCKEIGITIEIKNALEERIDETNIALLAHAQTALPDTVKQKDVIILEEYSSYYHLVLAILNKLISDPLMKQTSDDLIAQLNHLDKGAPLLRPHESTIINKYLPNSRIKKVSILLVFFMILIGGALYYMQRANKTQYIGHETIRSDLNIPVETAFLDRPQIIEKLKQSFNKEDNKKSLELIGVVGTGGSGKTTIAHHFARSRKNVDLVWELNAETKETLINSFNDLAHVLATTNELREEIKFIQKTQQTEIQEKLLLNFIKTNLKKRSKWILIYDNMESFANISYLIPQDYIQWGNGKVIITTRNENILSTSFINRENIINIDDLTEHEMLMLFSKILYNSIPNELDITQKKEIISFLKHIPPFPLDVSVAAYSIKNDHITYEQYLQNIQGYSQSYDSKQLELLKETTSYSKTRFGIISSAMDKMYKARPDFRKLLLFICLMDSQNIPKKLLEQYSNHTILEDLIYKLRQNGLLLREANANYAKEDTFISLHRSTQEIGAIYFMNTATEEEKEDGIEHIINATKHFYAECVKNKNAKDITLLTPHLNSLLSALHKTNIPPAKKDNYEADIYLMLGYINFTWTKHFLSASEYLKLALQKNNNYFSISILQLLLKDLCNVTLTMNLLNEGIEYCQRNVNYWKNAPTQDIFLKADTFQIIGNYYRRLNDFEQADHYFDKALQSLDMVNDTPDQDIQNIKASIYSHKMDLYLMRYLNSPKGALAEEYSLQALASLGLLPDKFLFNQNTSIIDSDLSCEAARQRWKYGMCLTVHKADLDLAYLNLQEAEYIYQQKCPENIALKSRINSIMSEVLLYQNSLLEADNRNNDSIEIGILTFGINSIWTYFVTSAEIKNRLCNFSDAYDQSIKVISIGQIERSNFHDLKYWMANYHAAFAKYKLKDYQKSIDHFANFFTGMKEFCQAFLDKEVYNKLVNIGAFNVKLHNASNQEADIKCYLQQSLDIYISIFGKEHPFVKDYIAKNLNSWGIF